MTGLKCFQCHKCTVLSCLPCMHNCRQAVIPLRMHFSSISFSFSLFLSSPSKTKMFPQMHWSPSNSSFCFCLFYLILFIYLLIYFSFFSILICCCPRLGTGSLVIVEKLAEGARPLMVVTQGDAAYSKDAKNQIDGCKGCSWVATASAVPCSGAGLTRDTVL